MKGSHRNDMNTSHLVDEMTKFWYVNEWKWNVFLEYMKCTPRQRDEHISWTKYDSCILFIKKLRSFVHAKWVSTRKEHVL